jgi:C4-dicarboxylate transporter/malic acid transport protein
MNGIRKKGFTLKDFVPSWPSSVMGTGIIPVALSLGAQTVPWFRPLAIGIFLLSVLLLAVVIVLWVLRLIRHPGQYHQELHHPIAGSFLPTMPIALMIISIGFLQIIPWIFGEGTAHAVAGIGFILGTFGIYLFSWLIMPALFQSTQVSGQHGTFGWFIPPVSHLIVPVVGLELLHVPAAQSFESVIFFISMASLGIGFMLFLLMGPNVLYRYIYQSSPVGKMAPTLLIALAPTSILIIVLIKINSILGYFPFLELQSIKGLIQLIGPALWGFSFWWLILSVIKIGRAFADRTLPFTLSWWAFTFPIGAIAVATGALNKVFNLDFLRFTQVGLTILLLAVWLIVVILTMKGIGNRSIFEE